MASLPPLPVPPARGLRPARFLGALAVMLNVVGLAGRRFDLVNSDTLVATLLFALALSLVALGLAALGMRDIWRDGRPGAQHVIPSIFLILLSFLPFFAIISAYALTPALDRVATDPTLFADMETPAVTPLGALTSRLLVPASQTDSVQAAAYPDVVPQAVDLSTVEAFAVAKAAVDQLGWKVIATTEPATEGAAGTITAEARSLALGLPSKLRIRIGSGETATRLDIASASTYPMPDLGENARNINLFLDAYASVSRRSAPP
ncbi:DUF1499 domain-containing protein [Oryzibacter oryziterrae]|uniref:DUF1499 domain-containing protein n=1 Tax=Oryzibacter oryziterrae TaxID=2766474 RepID=UPI001F1F55D4|nr:DUF1499 domain-containing protein [Oryzibacter oryziterrae]